MRQRPRNSRFVLAVLLALAVIFGPQWCCCTLKAVAASPVAADAGSCCCCCERPIDPASSCPAGGDHDGACPCRGKPRPVATPAGWLASGGGFDIGPSTWGPGIWSAAFVPSSPHDRISVSHGRSMAVAAPPVIGGRALLRALSVLRC